MSDGYVFHVYAGNFIPKPTLTSTELIAYRQQMAKMGQKFIGKPFMDGKHQAGIIEAYEYEEEQNRFKITVRCKDEDEYNMIQEKLKDRVHSFSMSSAVK